MKVKVLKPHHDQTTGKFLQEGNVHEYKNDFDLSHALAFKYAELYDNRKIERAVKQSPETRKRGRRKKADVT